MNLIEALKSGRRIRNCTFGSTQEWFDPYTNIPNFHWVPSHILCDAWEVEPPKPIVFECEWGLTGTLIHPFHIGLRPIIERLVGKRTRVTIEILDEQTKSEG